MGTDQFAMVMMAAVVLVSAAVQGFTGFGFGLVGMGFATMLVGPRDANILWTTLPLLLTGWMWLRLRQHTSLPLVACVLAGALLGQPVGVWVLARSGQALLRHLVGGAILAFATWNLVNPQFRSRRISPLWGVPAGAVSGFFSATTSTGGPAVVVLFLILGLDKEEIRGNLAAYFTLNILVKLSLLVFWQHMVRPEHVLDSLLLCAPLVAGMAGGMYASRFVSSEAMRKIICAFLLLPGAVLLFG